MYPNLDAIQFFIRESWPEIRRRCPNATLTLIGRTSEEQATTFGSFDGVNVLGFVHDIRPVLDRARCCIAPLRVGGGTRLKILEYWSMGKAVVSTAIGCEGLETVDGDNIMIRDDPTEIAAGVTSILNDADLASSMGSRARATVEAHYTWEHIGEDLRQLYHSLLGGRDLGAE
jgi:glycosyltransferase involved in cell wall biosynthesis